MQLTSVSRRFSSFVSHYFLKDTVGIVTATLSLVVHDSWM